MGSKKKMKGITDGDEDRISRLPESLIHHILSFLRMRDVVRTCLLSKRWRNIWKSTPVLNFGRIFHDHPVGNEFIDQSLIHYEGQKVKILQFQFDSLKNGRPLESWVRFAAMHGVEELDMRTYPYDGTLPSCLFECLEMRVLKLSLDECSPPLQPFRFPLLTELHFTDFRWNYLDTSACPLLQVLIIEDAETLNSLEIHAPNPKLRYLHISESGSVDDDNSRLTLYAPNLLHSEFGGSFARFYEFKDISNVKTCDLYSSVYPDQYGQNDYGMAESMVQLLKNVTHVKSLKLSQGCIQVLAYGEENALEIPSLSATCLELETNLCEFVLVGITYLLRASRCIKRLIIDMGDYFSISVTGMIDEDHDIDAIKGWESLEHALSDELALNTILIQNYPGYPPDWDSNEWKFMYRSEVKLVKVLLKSCKRLKIMNISIENTPSKPLNLQLLYGLTKKLLVFPRASVKAKVYFS